MVGEGGDLEHSNVQEDTDTRDVLAREIHVGCIGGV